MPERARRLRLPREAAERVVVLVAPRAKDFEGDVALERVLAREPDVSGRPRSEPRLEAVLPELARLDDLPLRPPGHLARDRADRRRREDLAEGVGEVAALGEPVLALGGLEEPKDEEGRGIHRRRQGRDRKCATSAKGRERRA